MAIVPLLRDYNSRMLSSRQLGGFAPKPPGFTLFSPQNGHLWLNPGDRLNLSPAFPAAEPVAQVASQQSLIPSGSGMPRMDDINLAVQ